MSTTTRRRTTEKSSSCVLEREPGLESLGAGIAPALPGDDRSELVERAEVCLARTLRSEVKVLFWSPIGGIQHRRQGRGPELTGRSQCGQVWRCGASVRAGLKEAVDASWWRTKVKRRKAFLGGASRPLAAMPDSYCWIRGRSGDAVTTKSQRFTQGDLLGPGRVGR